MKEFVSIVTEPNASTCVTVVPSGNLRITRLCSPIFVPSPTATRDLLSTEAVVVVSSMRLSGTRWGRGRRRRDT